MDLPNLKVVDRRKVMAEVKIVDGLLHNLVREVYCYLFPFVQLLTDFFVQ